MTKKLNQNFNNSQQNQTEKFAEKAIFGELYKARKISNLIHRLTFSIQQNKELITDNYPRFEWEFSYLQKELIRLSQQTRLTN